MASSEGGDSRFARVNGDEINQIIDETIPRSTKKQTNWSIVKFRGKETKQKLVLELRFFVCELIY